MGENGDTYLLRLSSASVGRVAGSPTGMAWRKQTVKGPIMRYHYPTRRGTGSTSSRSRVTI